MAQNNSNKLILDEFIKTKKSKGQEVDLEAIETNKLIENRPPRRPDERTCLANTHLTWIIMDTFMCVVLLITDLMYGDFKANFRHTVKLLNSMDNFLTIVIFHAVWNSICLCLVWDRHKKPYDFLLCYCCHNWIASFFHLAFMLLGGIPLAYGCRQGLFCPWTSTPALIELYSYVIRTVVVTLAGLVCARTCILKEPVPKKVIYSN